ncbi:MAG: putative toxin-antitoxin system toxin component, PIN family [bacterium]
MKIIFDTNIYFSAFVFDRKILNLLDKVFQEHSVYLSENTFKEITSKLTGDKIKAINKGYSEEKVNEFLTKIDRESFIVKPNTTVTICRDPHDNMFLELALFVKADYLVTGDNDLLVIKEFQGTKILKPSQFLEI